MLVSDFVQPEKAAKITKIGATFTNDSLSIYYSLSTQPLDHGMELTELDKMSPVSSVSDGRPFKVITTANGNGITLPLGFDSWYLKQGAARLKLHRLWHVKILG